MTTSPTPVRIAVIGAGMAGQAHAFGYRTAMMAVSSSLRVELDTIADPNLPLAQSVADRYGFAHATGDIDALLEREDIDAISVALPNFLHAEVLPKVLASGKHVLAEKPIGRTVEESSSLQALAEASPAVTGVGFSFRRLPGLAALAAAVRDGWIGEVHTVRGWYRADYAADPAGALSWRYSQEQAGAGAISSVDRASLRTVITERPEPAAGAIGHGASTSTERGPVDNDDIALLSVGFASGAAGQIELSRIAHGTPNSLGVEVFGTNGHVTFESQRAGEFTIFEAGLTDAAYNGPRTVVTGPEHPYFRDVAAMPGGGVGTGYAEAFTAEIQEFVRAIGEGAAMDTDFAAATAMMRVVGAALESHRSGQAVEIA